MKHFLLLSIFLLCTLNASSQRKAKEVDTSLLYEDYDQFLTLMEDLNPQLEVRQLVTGEDLLKTLKQRRSAIDSISTWKEFYLFFNEALKLFDDGHTAMCTTLNQFRFSDLDSLAIKATFEGYAKCKFTKEDSNVDQYFPLYLGYLNGNYILALDLPFCNLNNLSDTLLLPMGSIIRSINGKDIELYVDSGYGPKRWDNQLKKKYRLVKGAVSALKEDSLITFSYIDMNNEIKEIICDRNKYSLRITSPEYLFYSSNESPKVEYFKDGNILYIRNPSMAHLDYYETQIKAIGKNKDIKKIIWDIRRNPGGNDEVWQGILGMLIKDTLTYDIRIASMDTPLANKILELNKYGEVMNLPYLKKKYRVNCWGASRIIPHRESLCFDGPIYVLQDNIYSSAGSVSSLASLSDQLISVGLPSGYLLGNGITPLVFQLKNSKFAFQFEPVIEVSNVKGPYDYYHDSVEVPVELTREDYIRYFGAERETLYSKEFLYKHDPIFKKALEL